MITIHCDRCKLEIREEEEGVPLKANPVVDESGVPVNDLEVATVSDDKPHDGPRLVFTVIDEDGEPMDDVHFCTRCAQAMIEEFADKFKGADD